MTHEMKTKGDLVQAFIVENKMANKLFDEYQEVLKCREELEAIILNDKSLMSIIEDGGIVNANQEIVAMQDDGLSVKKCSFTYLLEDGLGE